MRSLLLSLAKSVELRASADGPALDDMFSGEERKRKQGNPCRSEEYIK